MIISLILFEIQSQSSSSLKRLVKAVEPKTQTPSEIHSLVLLSVNICMFCLLEPFLDVLQRFKSYFWKVCVWKIVNTSFCLLEPFPDVLEHLKGHMRICKVCEWTVTWISAENRIFREKIELHQVFVWWIKSWILGKKKSNFQFLNF